MTVAAAHTRRAPDAAQLTTWRTFLRAHAAVTRRLEHDLLVAHDLPLASYDVLVQLSQAPSARLRMTDLADRVLLSRSGLTRLVDRLEREGLVARTACPSDHRGTLAELTDRGRSRLREATPTHLSGIAEYVTDRFAPDELARLGELLARIVEPADARAEPCPPSGDMLSARQASP